MTTEELRAAYERRRKEHAYCNDECDFPDYEDYWSSGQRTEDLELIEKAYFAQLEAEEQQAGSSWDFACKWYSVEEIRSSIERSRKATPFSSDIQSIPEDIYSEDFAKWMTQQYRLAMAKGIDIGKRQSQEQQAADGELPVDGEWLKQNGWSSRKNGMLYVLWIERHCLEYYVEDDSLWLNGRCAFHSPTRRQVLDLMRALGAGQ